MNDSNTSKDKQDPALKQLLASKSGGLFSGRWLWLTVALIVIAVAAWLLLRSGEDKAAPRYTTEAAALGNSGAATSSLLAGITSPVFNAGRLRAQVEIQDAVREQAQVSYEQAVLTALQEVENALVALARNRERVEALAIAAESARNAAELARQRYSAGLIDFQSVLDTERSVLSAEDSLASSRADGVLALIRLYKALGGGWSPQTATRPVSKDAP